MLPSMEERRGEYSPSNVHVQGDNFVMATIDSEYSRDILFIKRIKDETILRDNIACFKLDSLLHNRMYLE